MAHQLEKKTQERSRAQAGKRRAARKGMTKTILKKAVAQKTAEALRKRKQQEGIEVAKSSAQLASIIESSQDAILNKALDGTILSWNKGAERLYGYKAKEIIGKNVSILTPPGHEDDLKVILRKLRSGKRIDHYEMTRVRKDGDQIIVSVGISPIRDQKGKLIAVSSIARDITLQKRTEKSLAVLAKTSDLLTESLDYEKTIQAVADLIVRTLADWCTVHVLEEDGTMKQLAIAHADPKMLKLAKELNRKYPPPSEGSQSLREVAHSGKSLFIPVITDEMLAKSARDEEHPRMTRSLHLRSVMSVPLTANGRHFGALSLFSTAKEHHHYSEHDLEFAQSVAARASLAIENARLFRKTQRALEEVNVLNAELENRVRARTKELETAQARDRANLRRLKAMLSHLPLAAILMDEGTNILQLNERYCQTFHIGLSAEKAMAIPKEELNQRFQRCIPDTEAHMREVSAMMSAKKPKLGHDIHLKDGRIIQRDFIPIYDEDELRGRLFLYRDVTKDRRVDASKSEFMSLASHQPRTPLTAIRWSLGRLQRNLSGQIGALEEHLLEDSTAATRRMSETITTMLEISRIQAGQIVVNRTEIFVDAFLRELAATYGEQCAKKNLTVEIDCPKDLSLKTDPQLLIEVIGNLLANASKYTPENGAICLRAFQQKNTISVQVQDSGYGIPLHQQQNVFKKFFRGDNVVSKDPDGTGLGLYLVSLVVRLLGGAIRFESREGRGTTFTLSLPVV